MRAFGVKLLQSISVLAFIFTTLTALANEVESPQASLCVKALNGEIYPFTSLEPKDPNSEDGFVITTNEVPLTSEAIITAYKQGAFPWNPQTEGVVSWYNPPRHGVIDTANIAHRTRSKFKSLISAIKAAEKNNWRITYNQAFEDVIQGCAENARNPEHYSHVWLTPEVQKAFIKLHKEGVAHSVEVWDADGVLIGGTYGLYIEGVFSGESMFNHNFKTKEKVPNAGKVAVVWLLDRLYATGHTMMDSQTVNPNTKQNYKAEWFPREDYLARVKAEQEAFRTGRSTHPFK